MFSFRLSDEFISQYKDREPDWGYRDAAGNAVGEITFLRTYSRVKPCEPHGNVDNSCDCTKAKERWWEVCERVIDGMYSIQKDHCKANRLPWNDHKAQVSAQEAFDRLFQFKWMPPGRGLWMMGTPLVMVHKNSAALQNCFSGDTKFITRDGIRTLRDAEGEEVEVWTDQGWTKGAVKSFGSQSVQRITFAPFGSRSNHRVVEIATPDHRWELRDGSTTTDLKVGDVVPARAAEEDRYWTGWTEAFIHGLMFADGSVGYMYANGDYGHQMRLCGDKDVHTSLFERVSYQPNCDGDPVVYHRSPINMKALPTTSDPNYVSAFISGWVDLDGSKVVRADGHTAYLLSTQDEKAVTWLKENAAIGGYVVTGHNVESSMETNYGPRSSALHLVTLEPASAARYWTVKSIEVLEEQEEVYCAVVPDVERFTLASGVYTSNCGFVSTANMPKNDPAKPLAWLMEASMLGIGVGFDTKGADKGFTIHEVPDFSDDPILKQTVVIPDDREGWVESMRLLINNHLRPNPHPIEFDYSLIRPAGSPIKTFGGTAAGPEPLMRGHQMIRDLFKGRDGQALTRRDIADIGNILGVVVVSGNVRRSAELLMGSIDDPEFIQLKNPEVFPERQEWAFMSNNSVEVTADTDLSPIIEGIKLNGEPGVIWMDITRNYGRLIDPPDYKDWRAAGFNPCAEQSLESYELCTLDEAFLNRHESKDDLLRSLKFAYLYGKTVTLLPTHWPETNAVMQRNRRIGTSVSGVADFADAHGLLTLRDWLNDGYAEVRKWDHIYSEWLAIRESIRVTTVKPSGTVSLLAGASPGVHWAPGGRDYLRGIVFGKDDPIAGMLGQAGYTVETSAYTPDTSVFIQFPIHTDAHRDERQVSLYEKANLAVVAQRYWSDNSVSVTLSFDAKEEADAVERVLTMHAGQLKTVSFLPMGNDTYAQMPYQRVEPSVIEEAKMRLFKVDFSPIYDGDTQALEALGEAYCSTDACLIPNQ